MTPAEYKAALSTLGLSQQAAGRWLGVSPRTAQTYASKGPSKSAALAVRQALELGGAKVVEPKPTRRAAKEREDEVAAALNRMARKLERVQASLYVLVMRSDPGYYAGALDLEVDVDSLAGWMDKFEEKGDV